MPHESIVHNGRKYTISSKHVKGKTVVAGTIKAYLLAETLVKELLIARRLDGRGDPSSLLGVDFQPGDGVDDMATRIAGQVSLGHLKVYM